MLQYSRVCAWWRQEKRGRGKEDRAKETVQEWILRQFPWKSHWNSDKPCVSDRGGRKPFQHDHPAALFQYRGDHQHDAGLFPERVWLADGILREQPAGGAGNLKYLRAVSPVFSELDGDRPDVESLQFPELPEYWEDCRRRIQRSHECDHADKKHADRIDRYDLSVKYQGIPISAGKKIYLFRSSTESGQYRCGWIPVY